MIVELMLLGFGYVLGKYGGLPGGKPTPPSAPSSPSSPGAYPTHVVPAGSPSKAPWPAEGKRPATAADKAAMQAAAAPFMGPPEGTDEEALFRSVNRPKAEGGWKPKKRPTSAEVKRAHELLSPAVWKLGLIESTGNVQFRGAMHPNKSGSGTHKGVEVWERK